MTVVDVNQKSRDDFIYSAYKGEKYVGKGC